MGPAVAAVGRDHCVLLAQLGRHARADGLLAGAEVQKAADLLGAVQLRRHGFHAADRGHLAQQLQRLVLRHVNLQRRAILQLVQLVALGL